ncbi:hypothetical protein DEFDS_P098 (plasmid) [Deferribacter desulfuricans SSM1]|uniref:Dephospho-CoA kinase n=1 Tax=Deferribacter desulfuricans (strain DSM 14783 / JCM 11476 / NBRC 101012 / SSM1) TaxID=639282 RepID=D3PES9_DEFDS|nr:hypothetical protein [Deferribacter desulfuricans]BAI81721.1 hypothetical protein DEFDS_P098 [Deferribacter desulfuricans SSM1]
MLELFGTLLPGGLDLSTRDMLHVLEQLYNNRDKQLPEDKKDRLFLQFAGEFLKEIFGQYYFVDIFSLKVKNFEKAQTRLGRPSVILCDDIRRIYEYKQALRLGFDIYGIEADEEIRRKRAESNGIVFNPNHPSEMDIQGIMENLPNEKILLNNTNDMDLFIGEIHTKVIDLLTLNKNLEMQHNVFTI